MPRLAGNQALAVLRGQIAELETELVAERHPTCPQRQQQQQKTVDPN